MGIIQKLLRGNEDRAEFKERFKEAQIEDKVATMVEERKKSSNRRELERYMKEQEEAKIKEALDKINKKRNQDMWSSNTLLKKDNSMLKEDRPILKEKNIFQNNKNMFNNQNSMGFFK